MVKNYKKEKKIDLIGKENKRVKAFGHKSRVSFFSNLTYFFINSA